MDPVVHFEIPAKDLPRAQKFYKDLFGWKIDKVPNMDYHMVCTVECDEKGMPSKPGMINGGLCMEDSAIKAPVIVIKVSSLEAMLKKVQEEGGKMVMPKMKVGDMGYYARIADSEGNVVGLWEDLK